MDGSSVNLDKRPIKSLSKLKAVKCIHNSFTVSYKPINFKLIT